MKKSEIEFPLFSDVICVMFACVHTEFLSVLTCICSVFLTMMLLSIPCSACCLSNTHICVAIFIANLRGLIPVMLM